MVWLDLPTYPAKHSNPSERRFNWIVKIHQPSIGTAAVVINAACTLLYRCIDGYRVIVEAFVVV